MSPSPSASLVEHSGAITGQVRDFELLIRCALSLKARGPMLGVTVEIADGLEASADEGLVAIALENLIGKAWACAPRGDHAPIAVERRRAVECRLLRDGREQSGRPWL